jgi:hypothetical protein
LTINHQVIDGAPAARFLQALSQAIGSIHLLGRQAESLLNRTDIQPTKKK